MKLMTPEEEKIILERYPYGGYKACLPELGHYTAHQVHNRAYKLGLRVGKEALEKITKERRRALDSAKDRLGIAGWVADTDWRVEEELSMQFVAWQNEMLRAWR